MADGGDSNKTASPKFLRDAVQAHIGRASKLGGTNVTRDWGLYVFFRIHPQAEFENNHGRMAAAATALVGTDSQKEAVGTLVAAISHAACANAGAGLKLDQLEQPAPANAFRNWLGILTGAGAGPLQERLKSGLGPLEASGGQALEIINTAFNAFIAERKSGGNVQRALNKFIDAKAQAWGTTKAMEAAVLTLVWASYYVLVSPNGFERLMGFFGEPEKAGDTALSGGLLTTFFYEFLRQLAPAHRQGPPVLHPESASRQPGVAIDSKADNTPVTYAFTFSGLQALKVHPTTLDSFPEPFKQGMAARAERLGDTGPSAPEHWDGPLGLRSVHGYFLGGHVRPESVPEAWRAGLRDDVRAFNDGSGIGLALRSLIGALTMPLGLEVMHIELGEDPYEVENGNSKRLPYRHEHFGFRDGVSQPFVDMGLQDTSPGGGTPSRNRTWTPLAPGEIFLGNNDEGHSRHRLPINKTLREGSTFLVFRKLEQDVVRFRSFLAQQRPDKEQAQARLAAQLVGRWPNGTSLVTSSEAALDLGDDHEGRLNDFLYAADDPRGLKCPLSAHVRRANPRDIGGTDEVRRHRILRRGMAYGGRLLPRDSLGDGNKRGLLFICANSRIDLQFEVIQADWLNKGELLGQAGLNRCPLTGANDGGMNDSFLEAGAAAPVNGLPRFVITRGGDYFFAPGLPALSEMVAEKAVYFPPPAEKERHLGASMGRSQTPTLFSAERIKALMPRLLSQDRVIRYQFKSMTAGKQEVPQTTSDQKTEAGGANSTGGKTKPDVITFLGRHADVMQVLSINETGSGGVATSIAHYHEALVRLSRGEDMLVSTEPGLLTGAKRKRMEDLLKEAWKLLDRGIYEWMRDILDKNLTAALRRCGPSKRIDLVHDLATVSTYGLIEKVFGTPGPKWLTELAVSLQFSHAHVGALQPDWIQSLVGGKVDEPALKTMQIWSILLFLDIVGNYEGREEAKALSEQAGSEFLTHLNLLIGAARAEQARRPKTKPTNLLEAFVILETDFAPKYGNVEAYYTDVRMLLLELAGATLANIPATFGAVMETILKFNINLTDLVNFLQAADGTRIGNEGIKRLIYEATRITSPMQILMRRVAEAHELPADKNKEPPHPLASPIRLEKDEVLAALIQVANFDDEAFPEPFRFSLHPYLDGPPRKLENYLLFGPLEGKRPCWGRDIALFVIVECVKAAARLQGVQRVAGKAGDSVRPLYILTGLPARFRTALAAPPAREADQQPSHGAGTAPAAPQDHG